MSLTSWQAEDLYLDILHCIADSEDVLVFIDIEKGVCHADHHINGATDANVNESEPMPETIKSLTFKHWKTMQETKVLKV